MKKKWIALASALVVSASLIPCAAGAAMKEFTLEQAQAEIDNRGYDGYKAYVEGTDFTFWYRITYTDLELSEEKAAAGYLLQSISEDAMISVIVQDYGMTLREYNDLVRKELSPSAKIQKVNDVDFTIYDEPEYEGVFCRVAATELPDGKILEFVYTYKDKATLTEINCSIASICLENRKQ